MVIEPTFCRHYTAWHPATKPCSFDNDSHERSAARMKLLVSLLASVCAFCFGIVLTLFASMHVLAQAPPAECASPCDGPAYAGLGLAMFSGSMIGCAMAWLTFRTLRRWRTSTGA